MKTVELKITKEDLLGKYEDICDCPVARAFKRNFPNIQISVGSDCITNRNNSLQPYVMYKFDENNVYYNIKQNKEFTLTLNEVV